MWTRLNFPYATIFLLIVLSSVVVIEIQVIENACIGLIEIAYDWYLHVFGVFYVNTENNWK